MRSLEVFVILLKIYSTVIYLGQRLFCSFVFGAFRTSIYTLSKGLKIDFMGTRGTTQEFRCHSKHEYSAGPK